MSHKLSGSKIFKAGFYIAVSAFFLGGCDPKISGHPEKVASQYIEAVQKNDFKTIVELNFDTSRSRKYLERSEGADRDKAIKAHFKENKAAYQTAGLSFSPGVRWAEKHYFPASALVEIGEPYPPVGAGEDDVNATYEMAVSAFVPVKVEYPDRNQAPIHNGRKIETASFECVFRKIREGENVRVYSHDAKWFFAGCIFNSSLATYR